MEISLSKATKFVILDDWSTIKISGIDKIKYLNGFITLDIQNLQENTWYQAGILTNQGKIRSIFWLILMENSFRLICNDKMKNNLIEDLLKYNINVEVKLEDITEEVPTLSFIYIKDHKTIGLGDLLGTFTWHDIIDKKLEKISKESFESDLIRNKAILPEIFIDTNPYESGFNHIITLEKGCFLGQEPISRMYHRGKPRKLLYLIISEGDVNHGDIEFIKSVKIDNMIYIVAFLKINIDISKLKIELPQIQQIEKIGTYPQFSRL
jgi:tRNA-modifying protein YgfZ